MAIALIQHVVIISVLFFQNPIIITTNIIRNMIKKGNGTIAPGFGIHFVFSSFTLYPDFHTTKEGSHFVPDSSISYPKSH